MLSGTGVEVELCTFANWDRLKRSEFAHAYANTFGIVNVGIKELK